MPLSSASGWPRRRYRRRARCPTLAALSEASAPKRPPHRPAQPAQPLRGAFRGAASPQAGRGGCSPGPGKPGHGGRRAGDRQDPPSRGGRRLRPPGRAQVLTGRCYEAESTVPYMPFVEAIRAYVATRPPEALRAELGEAASDVAKLVSEIRTRIPDLPSAARSDGEEERHRLFEARLLLPRQRLARGPPRPASSMTSTGPTHRRSGCSSTCPDAWPTAASSWSGPTATSNSAAATPWPRPLPSCGGTTPTSGSCSAGSPSRRCGNTSKG